MSFTSYSPNNERFGFKMRGSFRVAYENQRPIIITIPLILLAFVILFVVILFLTKELIMNPEMPDFSDPTISRMDMWGFDVAVYGSYLVALCAILCIVILGAIGYCIILAVLKVGRTYTFTATEEKFIICPPEKVGACISINYADVIGISAQERKFIFAEHGVDITIKTKKGEIFLRYIHTPESAIKGLSETPFNIIMERAEIVSKPDFLV